MYSPALFTSPHCAVLLIPTESVVLDWAPLELISDNMCAKLGDEAAVNGGPSPAS